MRYDRPWSYYNPTRIVAGPGAVKDLPSLVPAGKGVIITSPGFTRRGLTEKLRVLFNSKHPVIIDNVEPNPEIEAVENCWKQLQGQGFDYVIGVGGGSVLDTAKALSYLLKVEDTKFSLKAHFVDKTILPDYTPLMMIAVPTTAGTGSEVTPFATIWDLKEQKKYSLASPGLSPTAALLDPELTLSLPEEITIITGLDALSHALESVWNHHANPISISYAARAIDIVLHTLPKLIQDLKNLELRAKMLTGSLFGGLCISSTRTALAHSISYPLTAHLGVPHGLACSFTLPALFEFNAGEDDGRFVEVVRSIGYDSLEEFGQSLREFYELININTLMIKYQMTTQKMLDLAPKMFTPERSDNNLRSVNLEDVKMIISVASKNIV
jgi:alcohol dehydrogenase